MYLTFDWDSVGLEDNLVQEGLSKLSQDFPNYDVYYRLSASQTGIHAIISPIAYFAIVGMEGWKESRGVGKIC